MKDEAPPPTEARPAEIENKGPRPTDKRQSEARPGAILLPR